MSNSDEKYAEALKLHENDRITDAEHAYRKILSVDPEHTESLHMLGVAIAQLGRVNEGIRLIRDSVERERDNSIYQSNLGEALRQIGKIDDAIIAFRNAIERNSDNFDATHSLAVLLAERGKNKEAIDLARRATELRPSNATAHISFGQILMHNEDSVGAMKAVTRALEIVPNYEKALNLQGLILREKGLYEDAILSFEAGLRTRPSSNANRLNLAVSLTALQRYDKAIETYEEYLRRAPNKPIAYIGLGQVHRLQKKYLASEQRLLEGLKLFPRFRALHCELGLTYIVMGRVKDAGEYLQAAARGDDALPDAIIAYGKYLLQTGHLPEAKTQFESVLKKQSTNKEAKDGLRQARGEMPINVKWYLDSGFPPSVSKNNNNSTG